MAAKGRNNPWYRDGNMEGYGEYRYGASKKPVTLAPVFRKERRRHIIDEIMDVLRDWRSSEFEFEGPSIAGLRSALCLKGHRWAVSDHEARSIVDEGLRLLGAKRPNWSQGQREYTIAEGHCIWCGLDLSEDLMSGKRQSRFCGPACAKAHLMYRDFETRKSVDRHHAQAYEVIARENGPEKKCQRCGINYRPHNARHGKAQKYCSKPCADAAKLTYERKLKVCPTCAVSFLPSFEHQIYCERKCRDQAYRKYRPRDCRGCGRTFTPYNSAMVYCSSSCFHSQKSYGTRTCEECGDAFEAKHHASMYCGDVCNSRACLKRALAAQGKEYRPFGSMWETTCEVCDTNFLTRSHRAKTCSYKCRETLRLSKKCAKVLPFARPPLTLEIFDGWFKRAA